jgi:hypothetical protein
MHARYPTECPITARQAGMGDLMHTMSGDERWRRQCAEQVECAEEGRTATASRLLVVQFTTDSVEFHA